MDQLLKGWQMPDGVIDLFIQNSIEPEHLGSLTDDNLKELCPLMGVRIKLKKKISEFLDSLVSRMYINCVFYFQATTDTATSASSNTDYDFSSVPEQVPDLDISLSDILIAPQFQNFDLKTLLETSPCGKSILQFYNTNGCLDTKRRNRLTDIIIRHLFTFIVNKRLTYDDYTVLSGKIITLFPKESAATYFTRPIKKSDSFIGKSVPAKGKLIDRVRNLLFQSGERKRKCSTNNTENIEIKRKRIINEAQISSITEVNPEHVTWLQQNQHPWEEVVEKWRATASFRHEKEYDNVAHFIQEWSILNNPKAVQLIDEDFNILFPGRQDCFRQNWQPFCKKIFQLKASEIKSDDYKEDLLSSLNCLSIDEEKIPTELALLVHTVPPKGRTCKKRKFSVRECLESIMIIVENPGDITKTVAEKKEEAHKQREPVQPYIILLGSLQNIHHLYVVIDDIKYIFNSALHAFDTLFKSFQVFNAKYNKASDHIMLIIQRCIYKITTKYDNPVPYISDILDLEF
ncbi:hypothetical protein ACJJTC_017473 [Scirpophaga incertulas]